jgi:hypothetical protein
VNMSNPTCAVGLDDRFVQALMLEVLGNVAVPHVSTGLDNGPRAQRLLCPDFFPSHVVGVTGCFSTWSHVGIIYLLDELCSESQMLNYSKCKLSASVVPKMNSILWPPSKLCFSKKSKKFWLRALIDSRSGHPGIPG